MPQHFTLLDFEPFDPGDIRRVLDKQRDLHIPVRRPVLGLEINGETYATLHILYKDLSPRSIVNTSDPSGTSQGTSNFIITHVTHSRQERIQLGESFSSLYLFSLGEKPRILQVSGVLLKSKNFPWKTEWLRNYDNNMRATKTVEDAARIYLTIEDTIYEGYMLSCEVVDQADTPNMSPMQFAMFLTNVIYGNTIGPARTGPASRSGTSATPVSTSEYLRFQGEDFTQSQYAFDEYGNFNTLGHGRYTTEDLGGQIARHDLLVATANDLMERLIVDPSYPGDIPEARDARDAALVDVANAEAEALLRNQSISDSVASSATGRTNGADRGDQAGRREGEIAGSVEGGDVDSGAADLSEILDSPFCAGVNMRNGETLRGAGVELFSVERITGYSLGEQ